MRRLIKFQTQAGRVPYFVNDYTSVPLNGEFAGVSHDTDDCYLPETVTIISADEFLAHYAAAGDDGQPLLDKWVAQGNIKLDSYPVMETIEDKKDALWTYAKRYQLSKIDDGGLGVVLNANLAAMLQSKPHGKCEDIIAWSRALWFTDYEARIAAVEAGGAVDLDFSCHGELPWRVVEAVNETEGGAA